MNPKLHCSRDASVSHDRLKTTVAIQRKLHTRLRPLVFHHFFPADSFPFFPSVSLSFFHNSLSVPRDANIKVIRIAKRGIVRTNKERERGKKENKQTEKKKRFHKDRTRFEKPRCRPFIVSVVYFRNASFCHCFVECKRQEKLRGEIRSRIRNVHAIWYAIKFINRNDDANIFVACENNFLIRQRCKRRIRL